MHEVSLVAELVDECVKIASGKPVQTVRVRYATTIPEDGLHQAFTMLVNDSGIAGAKLEAESFDIRLDCSKCDFNGPLEHDDVIGHIAICPTCNSGSSVENPTEIELIEVVTN